MRVWRGRHHPLGATWDGRGVNVAVVSEHATAVDVCLYDGDGDAVTETRRMRLPECTANIWHGYFPDLRPGQRYGLRAEGPYEPERGLRFNPHKLLFDPYARAVARDVRQDDALYGYVAGGPDADDRTFDTRDSGPFAPLAAVVDPAFSWGTDTRPRRSLADTVAYELHVKGFTARHPGVPEGLRGTYAGLASPAAVDHLLHVGVTAVELLPVHYRVSEAFLVARELSNYWGYNTLGFFAPDPRLAAATDPAGVVSEFKAMVATLHDVGIAVLLDVVYNHTAEGNQLGPTLSFRGLDNPSYYHLGDDPRFMYDVTGTGNSFNLGHPRTLQLVTDSLRYWVQEMHVDGFRFDLAPELARQFREFDRLAPFFELLIQDPVLSDVHLIAEPWDVGPGGYGVGDFPVNWSEWNGRYRDTVRRFWRGEPRQVADLATRLAGSSDLYGDDGRRPSASVNFVTVHDGFTLHDLVTYDHKHNEANGEGNADGTNDNASWNCGVEGETDDPEIRRLRRRQQRNLLLTLVLSQGVPLLQAGDEIARTQLGNNNAYSQDNELSWLDWELDDDRTALLAFTRRLLALRAAEPVFRRRRFFSGRQVTGDLKDLYWLSADGRELRDQDWTDGWVQSLGMLLIGDEIDDRDDRGRPVVGDSFVVLLNAAANGVRFTFPPRLAAAAPRLELDTFHTDRRGDDGSGGYLVEAHSAVVLRVPTAGGRSR
jgi:glycogen operon protein